MEGQACFGSRLHFLRAQIDSNRIGPYKDVDAKGQDAISFVFSASFAIFRNVGRTSMPRAKMQCSPRPNKLKEHSQRVNDKDAKGQDAISCVFLVSFTVCRNVGGANMLGVKIHFSSRPNKSELHSKPFKNKDAEGQDAISFVFLSSFIICRNVGGTNILGVKIQFSSCPSKAK